MKLLFELSKEHTTLPRAEILSALDAERSISTIIHSTEDVLVVDVPSQKTIIQRLAERLALSFIIDEFLFSCPATLDDIVRYAKKYPLPAEGSIAIRCNNRSSTISSEDLIDKLGDVYTKNRLVDLRTPDIELRAILAEDTIYVGLKKTSINTRQFQQRRGHLRPFLSPITLHPKIARALVNLSIVKKQETLLDPFCGTGGILLEAGLLGVRVFGSDIEEKMIEGCRKNLDFYQIKNFQLFCTDIAAVSQHISSVDAVVTDFPYARATTTKGEHLTQLYRRAFQTIAQVLKDNGCAVIGLSNEAIRCIGEEYLSLIATYPVRSHRSLTRYFVVYKKS
ncbi:MAG: methyltransferase domain-containing protein [Candidatus Thermoplasmatota archaeon]|nr:methyltransferase domain-containing protein [Candidatus Thermoplasmatota archaeon]